MEGRFVGGNGLSALGLRGRGILIRRGNSRQGGRYVTPGDLESSEQSGGEPGGVEIFVSLERNLCPGGMVLTIP